MERKRREIDDIYNNKFKDIEKNIKDSAMKKEFSKSNDNNRLKNLENKVNMLEDEINEKDQHISTYRVDLYKTKERFDEFKLEYSKLKDNLAETSNELMIERNKHKMLTITNSDIISKNENINFNDNTHARISSSIDNDNTNDELKYLKNELDNLRSQVNKLSFNEYVDDHNVLKSDLLIVKE